MATVTATAQAYYAGGETTNGVWIGYSSDVIRTVRYQFTTDSNGATSISFSFQGPTNPSGNSTAASINWYVTTDSTSHASAGASAIKNGTCSASYNSSTYAWTISVSNGAVKLLPNTTYYLWLFPNHSNNNYYFTINRSWATTMSVILDGTYKSYTLTFSQGTGTSLTVKKSDTTLSSGATVYTGDVITVSYSALTGYGSATCSVSSVGTVSNDGTFTVSTNHTITTSASVLSYSLSISAGTGSTITVNRTSSPLQGALTGNLSNGTTIYYNDVLKITFSAKTGYNLATTKVNGNNPSGDSYTVTGAVSVVSTASLKSYTLTITPDAHSVISVYKDGSALSSGDTIYHFDALSITVTAQGGYKIKSAEINGTSLTPDIENSYEVSGDVIIVATSSALGFVYIGDGEAPSSYIIYIGTENGIERFRAYVGTDSGLVAY